jgi:hypothetical protein
VRVERLAESVAVLARLRKGHVHLDGQERADLGYFMAFQAARVPAFRDAFEMFTSDLFESVLTMSASHPESFKRGYREANTGKDFTDAEIEEARQAICVADISLARSLSSRSLRRSRERTT